MKSSRWLYGALIGGIACSSYGLLALPFQMERHSYSGFEIIIYPALYLWTEMFYALQWKIGFNVSVQMLNVIRLLWYFLFGALLGLFVQGCVMLSDAGWKVSSKIIRT